MKIELYSYDNGKEVFRDCTISHDLAPELVFEGVNWNDKLVRVMTTLPYKIETAPVERKIACNPPESVYCMAPDCPTCKGSRG